MNVIKQSLKDFEVARAMFGSNTKEQCKTVKKLREDIIKNKHTFIRNYCEIMSVIEIDGEFVPWFIPNECVEKI